MATRQRRKTFARRLIMPTVTAAFLGYFAYHAFHGEYGLLAQARLEGEKAALQGELDRLAGERAALSSRVSMLRPESLDADMLDELARANLSYTKPGDLVLYMPAGQR
ncbi:MAG: septum formation inhibitor [Hyphomicrobiales bacterium]|nr:MAG: septum formation inhibitor [Hyphomicrobiales bacterium]